jgi:hypothetical protein
MSTTCVHENDVVAAVTARRWESADEELKMHAAHCEICRDVVAVASLFASDREQLRREVHVPAAGQVWWRAAVRARLEAAHAATLPLTWLHGIATACAVGLAWGVSGLVWPTIRDLAAWVGAQAVDAQLGDVAALVTAAMQKSLPLAFVLAACLVLAPVALYLALSDE